MATGLQTAGRRAPAKVNLGLHILGRRADGFHEVETVLAHIGWFDQLEFKPASDFRFSCSDPSLPVDDRNLCVRAAKLLANVAGISPHGELHLEKNIPYAAGLGGGSSDAANSLRLLAEVWDLDIEQGTLHDLAAELGSDVPFFLHDEMMLATGRGERLRPITLDVADLPDTIAVVVPDVEVSTADAYGLVEPTRSPRTDLLDVLQSKDIGRWRRELTNDFEAPIIEHFPPIATELVELQGAGARYASLSGSGSAVFGLFDDEEAASRVTRGAQVRGLRAWCGPLFTQGN